MIAAVNANRDERTTSGLPKPDVVELAADRKESVAPEATSSTAESRGQGRQRTLSRSAVRDLTSCPHCGAAEGSWCFTWIGPRKRRARKACHMERVLVARVIRDELAAAGADPRGQARPAGGAAE